MVKNKKTIDQHDFDFIGLIVTLWQKKFLIIISSILFGLIGYYYSSTIEKVLNSY